MAAIPGPGDTNATSGSDQNFLGMGTVFISLNSMPKKIEAFWNSNLFEVGIGNVVVARYRSATAIEAGVFLVDTYCLGVKDAYYNRTSPDEYEEMFEQVFPPENRIPVAPATARKLVDESIAYARRLGFSPHRDYKKAARVLGGIKAADSDETFVFGYKGKPFYVQSNHDSPERAERTIRHLEARCGQDGFHHLLAGDLKDSRLPRSGEDEEPETRRAD